MTNWWVERGAQVRRVMSEWRFRSREDLEAVLHNEFRNGSAEAWLAAHPDRRHLSYAYLIFILPAGG